MTIVIGVDPAAARLDAVALLSDGFELHKRTMPRDIVDRCVTAQRWVEGLVKQYAFLGPVVVGVEEPVLGLQGRATGNGTLPVAKVHGALLAGAHRAGALVIPINNKAWKKRIVGNGNASKPAINMWVKTSWPALWIEAKGRQDSCDAACIALDVVEVLRVRRKMDALRKRTASRKEAA